MAASRTLERPDRGAHGYHTTGCRHAPQPQAARSLRLGIHRSALSAEDKFPRWAGCGRVNAPITYGCRNCGGSFEDIRDLWYHPCEAVAVPPDDQQAFDLDELDERDA